MTSRRAAPFAAATLAAVLASPGAVRAEAPTPAERVAALERDTQALEKRLAFVLDQYGREVMPTDLTEAERRFSEAEIHFLLEDYGATAVLLYDLVDAPVFKRSSHYRDALYYLAESLYRQESYLPAKQFFLSLVKAGGGRYLQDALVRLVEISGRTGDYGEVDGYLSRLVAGGTSLRPQVLYVYGKFLHQRKDLKPEERITRALRVFSQVPADSEFGRAARYFIGALHVEQGDLKTALADFLAVTTAEAAEPRGEKIVELAWMAVGRVRYELGDLDGAIDAYQRIDRHSENFYESLYEIAWTYVKKGELDNATKACEILLVGASDTPLAPEARILLGNLQAREQHYDEAVSTYTEVINTYSPVRDEIDALLSLHADPVQYFNELIAKEGASFDVENLLPPVAVQWASTEEDVSHALGIVKELESGGTGVAEGEAIADRILASLDAGTLEPFPTLAEGHRRGVEVRNGLLQLQSKIAALEADLVGSGASPELQARLDEAKKERGALEARVQALPSTKESRAQRDEVWIDQVEGLEKEVWNLKVASDSLDAQIVAVKKYLRDTQGQRTQSGEDEVLRRLETEKAVVDGLHQEASGLLEELTRLKDAVRAGTVDDGEGALRAAYEKALVREREAAERARTGLGAGAAVVASHASQLRERIAGMSRKVDGLLADIDRRAAVRRDAIRQQVLTERRRLESYGGQVQEVMGDTKDLVGRIALESFKNVRSQFYALILKADVGIIDVAWAKKADKSKEIQRLAQEKDRQLRLLDRDFAEVLEGEQ